MGEKYVAEGEFLGAQQVEHLFARRTSIERRGDLGALIPDQVAIHGYVFIGRVERGEARWENRLLGIPTLVREGLECVRRKSQLGGDAAQYGVKRPAGLDRGKVGRGDTSARCQIGIGDFEAALGLVDDVVKIVFQRYTGHERS